MSRFPGASAGVNVTKAPVLAALEDGWSTVAMLVSNTDLSTGRVRGCLARGVRFGFIQRSEHRLQLVPQGSAYVYALTELGVAWLGGWRGKS